MASNINVSLIDATYPIAGQDNDVAGFHNNYTAIKTNLSTAKQEITALQTADTNLAHSGDLAKGATLVGFTPTTTLSSVNVQAAIGEVDGKIVVLRSQVQQVRDYNTALAATGDLAKGATLVGFTPAGFISSTNVQAALSEVASDLSATTGSGLVGHSDANNYAVNTVGAAIKARASSSSLSATSGAGLVGYSDSNSYSANTVGAAIKARVISTNLAASTGAGLVGFTPSGTLSSTTVQTAIIEVVNDLKATTGAGLVGFTPSGIITTNTVQAAVSELAASVAQTQSTVSGILTDMSVINGGTF